jgi:hypothetical protein
MNDKDFADMIRLARRAPLQNMDEAEAAANLIQRFASFANEYLEQQKQNKMDLKVVEK